MAFRKLFFKRVNDLRNKKQITKEELMELFKDTRQKFGSKIKELGPDAQAVLHERLVPVALDIGKLLDQVIRVGLEVFPILLHALHQLAADSL